MPADKPPVAVKRPEVVDPQNVPTVFADWIVTGGVFDGVVNVTLGTLDHALAREKNDMAKVVICTRLRCSQPFAERLYSYLGVVLGKEPPKDTSPSEPPQNPMMH